MRARILCLLLCAFWPLASRAGSLDEPLPVAASFKELISMLQSREVARDDFYAFTVGWGELVDPVRYLPGNLSETDRQAAAIRLFSGITPRQVIIAGHQVRMLRAAALARNPREKEDAEAIMRESSEIIRRYSETANSERSAQRDASATSVFESRSSRG
jgi:hypothetical protein